MAAQYNPDLIDALRVTLKHLEESGEFGPHDPTYKRLKRALVLTIGDLEERAQQRVQKAAA